MGSVGSNPTVSARKCWISLGCRIAFAMKSTMACVFRNRLLLLDHVVVDELRDGAAQQGSLRPVEVVRAADDVELVGVDARELGLVVREPVGVESTDSVDSISRTGTSEGSGD